MSTSSQATRAKSRKLNPRYVPTAEVAGYVVRLELSGMTRKAIARAAGVGQRTVAEIDGRRRIRADLAERILGVLPADANRSVPRQCVDVLLSALRVAGLHEADIARSLRVTELRWGARWVQWRTYERLRTLYQFCAMRGLVAAELLDDVP